MLFHISMVVIGLLVVGFGFWAIHYQTGFLSKLGGVLAPLGLLLTLLGGLLLAVPGFFPPLKNIVVEFLK